MNSSSELRIRLLTLNIRLGAGGEVLDKPAYDIPVSEKRDAALVRALQTVDADIVGLQEVRSVRQAQKIAAQLKLHSIYSPHPFSYSLNFFEWGVAVLSRFRLIKSGNFAVSFDPQVRSGRNGLWLNLEVQGKPVNILNVHLEDRNRAVQIDALVARAQSINLPLIIMGDFNCEPDDGALAPLKSMLTDSCRAVDTAGSREAEDSGTMIGTHRRIDYIFVTPDRFDVLEAGLFPPQYRRVSDHIGYFTDIIIKD